MSQNGIICREVEIVASNTSPQPYFTAPPESPAPPQNKRTFRAVVWGVSGTVLSAVGFIALTLFEQYDRSVTELQRDLKHFNEATADLVKKDSMRKCYEHLKESYKELQACNVARTQMERELDASNRQRQELTHELQMLRERLAAVEGRQAASTMLLPMPPARK
jgi:hypothetical protein